MADGVDHFHDRIGILIVFKPFEREEGLLIVGEGFIIRPRGVDLGLGGGIVGNIADGVHLIGNAFDGVIVSISFGEIIGIRNEGLEGRS